MKTTFIIIVLILYFSSINTGNTNIYTFSKTRNRRSLSDQYDNFIYRQRANGRKACRYDFGKTIKLAELIKEIEIKQIRKCNRIQRQKKWNEQQRKRNIRKRPKPKIKFKLKPKIISVSGQFDSLTTLNGKQYKEIKLQQIEIHENNQYVAFRHSIGAAKIEITNIPENIKTYIKMRLIKERRKL